MTFPDRCKISLRVALACSVSAMLASCGTMGAGGPTTSRTVNASRSDTISAGIQVIDVTESVAAHVLSADKAQSFADALGDGQSVGTQIGKGDLIDIALWEAPPAVLFGTIQSDSRIASSTLPTARSVALSDLMVDAAGKVTVPFVGSVTVAGRSPSDVQREIVDRLASKAHEPQALVRITRNATRDVTVAGDVVNSARVPLTPKGERVLDALASVGGAKQAVGKSVVQITRDSRVATLPLDTIIRDPRQNIRLQSGDVVTVLFQPFSFTALGAVRGNAEINFEGTGITLAQALGRVGGLDDNRADATGAFIFRLEDPSSLPPEIAASAKRTAAGKIPVIYRINLRDPGMFFVAQSFPVRNKDVLYVSTAPGADLQKFVNIVSSMVFSIVNIGNSL